MCDTFGAGLRHFLPGPTYPCPSPLGNPVSCGPLHHTGNICHKTLMCQQQQQHPIPSEHTHCYYVVHRGFHGGAMGEQACSTRITTRNRKTIWRYQRCQPMSWHDQHCSGYPALHAIVRPALNHANMPTASRGCSSSCAPPTL